MSRQPVRAKVYKMILGFVTALAVGMGLYGLYFHAFGLWSPARPEAGMAASWVFVPHPFAWVLVVAAGVLLLGLYWQQLWMVWIGSVAIGVFSAMNVFNIGYLLVLPSLLLLCLISVLTWAAGYAQAPADR